jgi:predicted DNA-binding antitoxin AbrB/MazE fold protein
MTIHMNAVYEHGTFRPAGQITLEEGTKVALTIETDRALIAPKQLVAALELIAAMPAEGPEEGFSGSDHDEVLYGSGGAR